MRGGAADDELVIADGRRAAEQYATLSGFAAMCLAGIIPGYANKAQMDSVAFAPGMGSFNYINMNHWSCGLSAIASFTGIVNLASATSSSGVSAALRPSPVL